MRKDRARYKTLVATSSILIAFLFAFSINSSYARNDDVPSSWLLFRSDRLKQRDQLLSTKAEQLRCWNEDENTLKILDQGMQLRLSLADRLTLVAAREGRMNCIGAHRVVMGNVDRAIIDVDKDLSYIESQITRIACWR